MNKALCKNPWCKAPFEYEGDTTPNSCWKCQSFEGELSGGVTWVEKKYEGPRFDNQPHEIKINVDRATDKKKIW